jgi:hypothetical protein
MKVYVVTTGSYSDYSIEAVFADRGLAEAHQAAVDVANEVAEFDVLTEAPTKFLVYNKSNNTHHGRGVPHEWSYEAWSYNRGIYKRADVTKYRRQDMTIVRVQGWDEEAVRKAYADALTRVEAEAQGLA